jgi:hypothetical protein
MAKRNESTRWVLTINNYTLEEEALVVAAVQLPECILATVGREVGAEGTPHLQGFLVFIAPVTRTALEAALGGRAYLQKMHGSVRQNQSYVGNLTALLSEIFWCDMLPNADQ